MKIYKKLTDTELVDSLRNGGVGLLPTDTIYGLSCSAYDKTSVEKIYDIKGRDKGIPVIVLISSISDLEKFRIYLDKNTTRVLENNWPGGISFIMPVTGGFEFLTRGSASLAFRMPDYPGLLELLQQTGPLISTSANPSGDKPAENIDQAKDYFGEKLDFYVDTGDLFGQPSTLVDLTSGSSIVLRQGQTPFKTNC